MRWPVAATPPSLDPQADTPEMCESTKEHTDAVRVLKMVRTYCCSITSKLIAFWLQRLKQWFNNHARGMAAGVSSERRLKPLNLSVRPTRKLSSTHTYTKLYYSSKLKPIVDKAWEEHVAENPGKNREKGERLRHQNKLIAELLSAETEEVKQKVEQCREEGIASDDDALEPEDAVESTSAREKLRCAKAYALQKYVFSLVCNDAS